MFIMSILGKGDYVVPWRKACPSGTTPINQNHDGIKMITTVLPEKGEKVRAKAKLQLSDSKLDAQFKSQLQAKRNDPCYQEFQEFRKSLPSHDMKNLILQRISSNTVVVISGETGCGKSTQVPQFILDNAIESSRGSHCLVCCTQPRRISASSVAERVASERRETCGGKNSSVGWTIKLDRQPPREKGAIHYCTTGVVLQWMKRNKDLDIFSHIILDEVHERDADMDVLMILLKRLIKKRKDLKIILMSATLNAESFSNYFGNCAVVMIPGRTFPVRNFNLHDTIGMIKTTLSLVTKPNHSKTSLTQMMEKLGKKSNGQIKFIMELLDYICNNEAKLLNNHKYGHDRSEKGAILIFLPGIDEINYLFRNLIRHRIYGSDRFILLRLHSTLPTKMQRRVFDKPVSGVRKIVLATNIAETSITIDDIIFVIDSGKQKVDGFDTKRNLQMLKTQRETISNALQRAGRAGRLQAGCCFQLFTNETKEKMAAFSIPEINRIRLEGICLRIKILNQGTCTDFFKEALDQPEVASINHAINSLLHIGAFKMPEDLTSLGVILGRLPLDPFLGRFLIYGTIFCCLDPVLSIVAALTETEPFIPKPLRHEMQTEMQKSKMNFAAKSDSDLIMFANAISDYEQALSDGEKYSCKDVFLSHLNLELILELKSYLASYLFSLGFISNRQYDCADLNCNSENIGLLKALIAMAFYPNVAKLNLEFNKKNDVSNIFLRCPSYANPNYDDEKKYEKLKISSNSVNYERTDFEHDYFTYVNKLETKSIVVKDSTNFDPKCLLVMGQVQKIVPKSGQLIMIDDWIPVYCETSLYQESLELRSHFLREIGNLIEGHSVFDFQSNPVHIDLLNRLLPFIQ